MFIVQTATNDDQYQRYIRYGSQTNKYMLKVKNRRTRKRSDYCSNLKDQSDITDVFLDFLWLTWNIFQNFSKVSFVDFE